MKNLEEWTWKEVSEHLIDDICIRYDVSRKQAKELLLNALTYNVVVASIHEQIDFLMEVDDEQ